MFQLRWVKIDQNGRKLQYRTRQLVHASESLICYGDWSKWGDIPVVEEESAENGQDTARLNWLETMHVEVRVPLVHGSRSLFHAAPDHGDGGWKPSDIRKQIDKAMK